MNELNTNKRLETLEKLKEKETDPFQSKEFRVMMEREVAKRCDAIIKFSREEGEKQ